MLLGALRGMLLHRLLLERLLLDRLLLDRLLLHDLRTSISEKGSVEVSTLNVEDDAPSVTSISWGTTSSHKILTAIESRPRMKGCWLTPRLLIPTLSRVRLVAMGASWQAVACMTVAAVHARRRLVGLAVVSITLRV